MLPGKGVWKSNVPFAKVMIDLKSFKAAGEKSFCLEKGDVHLNLDNDHAYNY